MPQLLSPLDDYSPDQLVLKRRSLRKAFLASPDLREIRIAVLGGSTSNELVDFWELYLLNAGFLPTFHQTEYGRYYSDAVMSPEAIVAFEPHLVYVHTSTRNIEQWPALQSTEAELLDCVTAEIGRFKEIWQAIDERLGCDLIQNNFDPYPTAVLGNLDAVLPGGRGRFITELNARLAQEVAAHPKVLLQDLHRLAAQTGLQRWFDPSRWHSYKIDTTLEGSLAIATSLTAMVRAMYGRTRKCLVLDLDNTLWGGVIGDDGADKIVIGRETPLAEAYTAFQQYCLDLRARGILLAACSKNTEEIARQGFEHPDSLLKIEHFSALRINWNPKHDNIRELAQELNLGLDSFVFVDDNPAERAIVLAQLPEVAVPDVGDDVTFFTDRIDAKRYFEPRALGTEDLGRAQLYQENKQRAEVQSRFKDYGEYLQSLEMTAEIAEFRPVYLERITQLTNKTNQFNLTTRRYTLAEIEAVMQDPECIGLYGRLTDRFGDNGLVSVVLGRRSGAVLDIDLWLMSCRVLKRDMEFAMLDALVERAKSQGIGTLVGHYIPTKKNAMVADHYANLGFHRDGVEAGSEARERSSAVAEVASDTAPWQLNVADYQPKNRHIQVNNGIQVKQDHHE
jgi:FkbH-like protein